MSVQRSISSIGTTNVCPGLSGSMVRKATHRSSRHTNVPGISPSMMRVKTEGMGPHRRIRRRGGAADRRRHGHHRPHPHRPERHHRRASGVPAGVPLAAVRTGEPGRGRRAPRGARRDRLRRRLHRPPLQPGVERGQGHRPGGGPPAAVHRRDRHPRGRVRAALVRVAGDRARDRRVGGHARAGGPRRPADRRHVVGQGGHVRQHVRLPAVPRRREHPLVARAGRCAGLGVRDTGAPLQLLRRDPLRPDGTKSPAGGSGGRRRGTVGHE